jgi:hypothetical protein
MNIKPKCAFRFSLQLLSATFLILRRNERDTIKIHIGLNAKCPLLTVYSLAVSLRTTGFNLYPANVENRVHS